MATNNGKPLESWIRDASCSIPGAKDALQYKDSILPLISAKRFRNLFDDEVNGMTAEVGSREKAFKVAKADHKLDRLYLPLEPDDTIEAEAKETDEALQNTLTQLGVAQ